MSDRNRRSEKLSRRFGEDAGNSKSDKTDKTEKTEQTDESAQTEQSDTNAQSEESVKDRPSVLMYLPEDLRNDLDIRFDELNLQHKREHGEPLKKNRDFYPAVVKAALSEREVGEVLEE